MRSLFVLLTAWTQTRNELIETLKRATLIDMQSQIKYPILLVLLLIFAPATLSHAGEAAKAIGPETTHSQGKDSWVDSIKDWALSLIRGEGYLHFKKGVRAAQARNDSKAIEQYEQAIDLGLEEPYLQQCHYNLALAYHRRRNMEKAIEYYKRAIVLGIDQPHRAKCYYYLGDAYYSTERIHEAIGAHKQAIELSPKDVLAHSTLGTIYYKQGRMEDAGKEFQTVLRLDPQNAGAQLWLERINRLTHLNAQSTEADPPYEDEGKLVMTEEGVLKVDAEDFLTWKVEESFAGGWTARIEGIATWNDKSSTEGTPAIGMPVALFRIDRDKEIFELIAETITDDQGYFTFLAPLGIETGFSAAVRWARNVPDKVLRELDKRREQNPD